jgi:branched-chain amino acid transport system ATP-binding protein
MSVKSIETLAGGMEAAGNTLLRTEGLSKQWGAFKANSDISLSFAPGARHALIGPNGAGKTTFINLLTGSLAPTSGRVFFGDQDITRLPQHERVKRGMTRTFQINTLFAGLTVVESVVLAICEREGRQFRWWQTVARQRDARDEAMSLLASLNLEPDATSITRSPCSKSRLRWRPGRACCYSTSRRPGFLPPKAPNCSR